MKKSIKNKIIVGLSSIAATTSAFAAELKDNIDPYATLDQGKSVVSRLLDYFFWAVDITALVFTIYFVWQAGRDEQNRTKRWISAGVSFGAFLLILILKLTFFK